MVRGLRQDKPEMSAQRQTMHIFEIIAVRLMGYVNNAKQRKL